MPEQGLPGLGKGCSGWIILSSMMLLAGGIAYIIEIRIIAGFINGINSAVSTGGASVPSMILELLPPFFAVITVKAAVSKLEIFFSCRITLKLKNTVRKKIFEKIGRLGPGYADSSCTAALITNTIDGVEALEVFFGRFIPQLFYSLLIPFFLFFNTLRIDKLFSFVMLAAVPVIPVSMVLISRWAARSMNNFWNDYQGLSSVFLENLQGIMALKLFNRSEDRMRQMEDKAWGFRNTTMELLRMQLSSITVMDTLVYGFAGLGTFLAVRGLYLGRIGVAEFFILLMLSVEFFLPVRKMGSLFHAGVNGIQAGKKIVSFLDSPEYIKDSQKGTMPSGSDIVFDAVSFAYADDLPEVLKSFSFEFFPGLVYGIAGPSGSGKSTFGRLLLRFHDPCIGRISFGGVPLDDIPLKELRKRITLVESACSIFDGTVESNLRLAKPSASAEEMLTACRRAGLSGDSGNFVLVRDEKDLGRKTGERGALLSGGERQRLAIARAILLDPDVFVFDEAAGSVDSESEEIIRQTILALRGGKTVFIISHRDSMFRDADMVLNLTEGRLVAAKEYADQVAGTVSPADLGGSDER